ncbi:hypothetical protein [Clostridium perfringens]|uniref:Putative lipoprotein n=1 Tax=Clostridium perfringens D str. JGS1721 TaxID=488537 RepID=B1V0D1_CLOPF|nr:hypothetical protein [Clostridium perfringens]EDT72684.1 putative lipoprotein [Clostridium perfringens D str. JGS1721]MDU2688357.1 hypothetical protein [Paeniclostridium sordellii]NGT56958.1 hypothetical protein [Clostridium perfringens]NGT96085.1 hypothetical protein [Clostridium perfringens]
MKLIRIISGVVSIFFIGCAAYGYYSSKTLYLADVILGLIAISVFAFSFLKNSKNN